MSERVANRVKSLRIEKNLTRGEISEKIGIREGKYKEFEDAGKKNYDDDVLVALADFHGVTIDYLLGRTDKKLDISLINEEQWELIEKSLKGKHETSTRYDIKKQ